MSKTFIALVTVVIILFTTTISRALDVFKLLRNSTHQVSTPVKGTVIEVLDGDTIILDSGDKVRYLGIDAPETHKKVNNQWIEVSMPFGREAANFNKSLVKGKTIKLLYDYREVDVYGRILAYVFVDDICVNTKILAEGLAFPYDIEKLKYYSMFRLAFFNALKSKKGLYKNFFLNNKLREYIGSNGWYRGKINRIHHEGDRVIIFTDYLDVHIKGNGIASLRSLKIGAVCYFYGTLKRKNGRYILLSENAHHIVKE